MTNASPSPYRIMIVCHGNICRSPMAAVILRQRFAQAGLQDHVVVESSGLSDEELGNPIDPRAARILQRHGYEPGSHTARQVEPAWLRDYDLLLAMDARQARHLRGMASDDQSADKVRLYRSFDPAVPAGAAERELGISDPWYGGLEGFEETISLLEHAADAVVAHVRTQLSDTVR